MRWVREMRSDFVRVLVGLAVSTCRIVSGWATPYSESVELCVSRHCLSWGVLGEWEGLTEEEGEQV